MLFQQDPSKGRQGSIVALDTLTFETIADTRPNTLRATSRVASYLPEAH
jgi:hypothetical protein